MSELTDVQVYDSLVNGRYFSKLRPRDRNEKLILLTTWIEERKLDIDLLLTYHNIKVHKLALEPEITNLLELSLSRGRLFLYKEIKNDIKLLDDGKCVYDSVFHCLPPKV